MKQILLVILAGMCFAAAVLSLPLPLPLGFFFFVTGLSLLLLASPPMQRRFAALREHYPRFDERLRSIEHLLPAFVRNALNSNSPFE